MERKLKATLAKALDKLLLDTLENTYYRLMNEKLLCFAESKEDFLYGIVVGDLLEGLGFCVYGVHKRFPKDKEVRDLFEMIEGRTEEIRARIVSMLSK
ncbi:MAG: hypothetical protein NWE81_04460 [Candidatus Bathyarchaeota archaeon]|jgi:hypothetical protein|nr:hypothetical protein [Candidatus Bathyarchaeota archaeon]